MLKIGEFSKLSRVSVRMLRHYDEVGLLAPSEVDPMTGYRYYSERQLITAGRIAALRALGFGLSDTRELLRLYDDRAALDARLAAQRTRLGVSLILSGICHEPSCPERAMVPPSK